MESGDRFIRDLATLTVYDPDAIRLQLFLRHRGVEEQQPRSPLEPAPSFNTTFDLGLIRFRGHPTKGGYRGKDGKPNEDTKGQAHIQ